MNFHFTLGRCILLVWMLFGWSLAFAQTTFTSTQNGDWNVPETWGNTSPGSEGTDWPASTDNAVISDGTTVKLIGATTINDLTINDGGIFDYDGYALTLNGTVTPAFVSQTDGVWTDNATWLGSPASTPGTGDKAIICRDHTITAVNVTVGTLIINSGGEYVDGNNNLIVETKLVLHGERLGTGSTRLQNGASLEGTGNHYTTGNLEITASATVTIAAETDIFFVGDIAMLGSATVNNYGQIRVDDITGVSSNTWVNEADSWLTSLNSFAVTLDATATGNTVAFTGEANNQTIVQPVSDTYHNLVIGGAQTKAIPASLTINGNLLIYSNLDADGFDLTIKGNWVNSGTFIPGNETVTFDGTDDQSITNTTSETFYNLTINKSSGTLTLNDDVTVTNILDMTSGDINAGTDILTVGTSTASLGSLSYTSGTIIGYFERWIANGTNAKMLFPVGTTSLYVPAEPTFSDASTTGGTVIVSFVEEDPGNEGLSLDDGGTTVYNTFVEGYWDFTAANGLEPVSFDLDLTSTGMTSFTVGDETRILKRINTQNDWITEGAHGTRSGDIVQRTGLTTLSAQYALADDTNCIPPVTYAITGDQDVVINEIDVSYNVDVNTGNTYYWSIDGGAIDAPASGVNINSITVDWGATGQVGSVSVYEENSCSRSAEVSLSVNIHTLPTSIITGSIHVTENQSGVAYSVVGNPGYTYTWSINGGVQTSGGTTNSILVDWGEANVGSVSVVASYPGAPDAEAESLEVDIFANILSIATGDWDDPTTWDCNCNPSDYQSVNIQTGHRVTLTANESIQNITVAGGAVLDQAAKYLTVQGNLILNGVITGTGTGLTFTGGTGLTIDGTGSINSTGTSVKITGEASIARSADLLILGDVDITTKRIVSNFGNVELNGDLIGGISSIWLNGPNAYLTTQGDLFASNGFLIATASGNTVEYATTSPSTGVIATPLQNKYYNLVLSGSVNKTTLADLTILGDLTINSGVLDLGTSTFDMTLEGNWLNKGNFSPGSQKVTINGIEDQTITSLYGGETFYDLEVNKNAGILELLNEVNVTNELTMTRGNIDASANKIILGTAATPTEEGTLSYSDGTIIGEFERWIDKDNTTTLHFPVGTSEHLRSIYFTSTTGKSDGSVIAKFVESNPGSNGLSATDPSGSVTIYNTFNEGYWDMSEANGFNITSGNYNLELTGLGFESFTLTTATRLLYRDDVASIWDFSGTHVDADVTNLIVKRTGMSAGTFPAQYAFGSEDNCTPPNAPSFTGVTDVCRGDNGDTYTITSSTTGITDYTWTVAGGSISSGQGTGTVTINWENTAQQGSVGLSVTNSCTISDETLLDVTIHTITPSSIVGSTIVPASTNDYEYSVESTTNYTYSWSINGGTITDTNSNTITVDWGTTGIGVIQVVAQNTVLGCPETEPLSLDVYKYVIIKSDVASGMWDDVNSWDCLCIPVAGDNPMILNGHTITMDADVTVEHLNVNIGGTLVASDNSDLTLAITGNLTVDGDIIVASAGNILNIDLLEGAGFDIGGIGTINPSITGQAGNFTISRGSCTISSTAMLTINDADLTIDPSYISVDNYGSLTLSNDLVSGNANFTWINQANSALKVEGSLLTTGYLDASATGNTVYYSDSSGTQNIKIPTEQYYHLTIGGDGTKSLQANTIVAGNLSITDAGILDVTAANDYSLNVAGNWTNNSTDGDAFLVQSSAVTFDGSTVQTITGAETFYDLTLNNTADGDAIVLADPITISNAFTLTDGQIVSDATNTITLDAGAVDAIVTVSAPSASSFVDGPLIHTVSSASLQNLIFPVGKDDEQHLVQLNITNADATTTTYTAEYINSAPSNYTMPGGINHVSAIGHWVIDQGAAVGVDATVQLYYLASDAVDTPADLRIVKDDGSSNWVDLGGTGSGSPTGSILSTNFTSFSDFALASSSELNPLPVTLLNFYAVPENTQVTLTWSTASEINNDYFTLEKSDNGNDFTIIGRVRGNGTTNLQQDYSFVDKAPLLGLSYYRLSQFDYDGTTEVFPVVSVLFEGERIFKVFPNPLNGNRAALKINKFENNESIILNIIDLRGRLVASRPLKTDPFGNVQTEIQLSKPLHKGTYIFELISIHHRTYQKVIAR